MLYTNRSLEILNEEGKRKLEITNLYDRPLVIDIDNNVSDKLISVEGKFHKFLSLDDDGKKMKLVKKKEGAIYLVLDLLDYKCFKRNSLLLKVKGDEGFKVLRYYRTTNRCERCKWGLHILKAPKREFSILKLIGTSGKEKFLTIHKGKVMMHSVSTIDRYLKENNIKFNTKDTEWELLKKKKQH